MFDQAGIWRNMRRETVTGETSAALRSGIATG
jgi:hypothetical protein